MPCRWMRAATHGFRHLPHVFILMFWSSLRTLTKEVQSTSIAYRNAGRQHQCSSGTGHGIPCLLRKGLPLQDYHTIYKLCYSDLQGELQRVAREHIETEGHALYRKHTQTQPLGQPGVALKVRGSP